MITALLSSSCSSCVSNTRWMGRIKK